VTGQPGQQGHASKQAKAMPKQSWQQASHAIAMVTAEAIGFL
jgi:hypothetical protein